MYFIRSEYKNKASDCDFSKNLRNVSLKTLNYLKIKKMKRILRKQILCLRSQVNPLKLTAWSTELKGSLAMKLSSAALLCKKLNVEKYKPSIIQVLRYPRTVCSKTIKKYFKMNIDNLLMNLSFLYYFAFSDIDSCSFKIEFKVKTDFMTVSHYFGIPSTIT